MHIRSLDTATLWPSTYRGVSSLSLR